jgi:hypothetical protein
MLGKKALWTAAIFGAGACFGYSVASFQWTTPIRAQGAPAAPASATAEIAPGEEPCTGCCEFHGWLNSANKADPPVVASNSQTVKPKANKPDR